MTALDWLLEGDPAIRWQAMRDLMDAPDAAVAKERSRVASEGWGAALLKLQRPDGGWGSDNPKTFRDTPDGSSIFVLMMLRDMGLEPTSDEARRAVALIRDKVTYYEGGNPFFAGEVEPCINGRALSAGAYFAEPDEALLDRLLDEQLEDGGWNCEAPKSDRSSFHTTICVLEGLLDYERARGATARLVEARTRGQEYLLVRRMLRSRSAGGVINDAWTEFAYPAGYHYDVLRGLDYLRSAGVQPDDRIAEAVELVMKNRGRDGRWPMQRLHEDRPYVEMERLGEPSRWNTLRALRVLRWATG